MISIRYYTNNVNVTTNESYESLNVHNTIRQPLHFQYTSMCNPVLSQLVFSFFCQTIHKTATICSLEVKLSSPSPSPVQSSPSRRTRAESMVPTAHHHHHHHHHRKLFKKFVEWNLYSIKSQKILSYIIIPTAHHHHHHHHHHRKLFKFEKK